jgi:hypothetical protein
MQIRFQYHKQTIIAIFFRSKEQFIAKEWLSKYSDGLVDEPIEANLYNDDRLGRALSPQFCTALRLKSLPARLKEYTVRIFCGNDSRIWTALLPLIFVWACRSASRASVSSNENAPSLKHRAEKRI